MRICTDARNRVRFDDDAPALLTFVQLPQTDHQPKPTSRSDWMQIATLVWQGYSWISSRFQQRMKLSASARHAKISEATSPAD